MYDRYRNYRPHYPRRKKRTAQRNLLVFICSLLILGGGFIMIRKLRGPAPSSATPINPSQKQTPKITAEPIASSAWNEMRQKITALIEANPNLEISVAVVDIATNTTANYGIQDNFAGASTTKVLTAAAYLHEVELGTRSLSTQINGKSAKTHLQLMINQSNNESWQSLNTNLTHRKLERYAHTLGMSSYSASDNTITTGDEALLLKKLYQGELLDTANRKLLLSYMQNTNNETMIPAVAPAGGSLYHKYGLLEGRLHDAAIIDYQSRPIALVIYTKGPAVSSTAERTARTTLIQEIASAVFATLYTL